MFSLLLLSFFTIVELNCENLFDFRHDEMKDDWAFTPEGSHCWTKSRYWHKLDQTAKTILSCADSTDCSPSLVALCEVENDSVLRDLTRRSLLRTMRYEYFITQSPDTRGIDVALLYDPLTFHPLSSHSLRVTMPQGFRPTRDILYVSGKIVTDDTLHVFVVHAPSKYGGDSFTRPARMAVMERLMEGIDSLRAENSKARIIVTGDFNEERESKVLCAIEDSRLCHVSKEATGLNGALGTYRYRGHWGSIDHFFVSSSLLPFVHTVLVNDAPFLLEEETKYGGVKPRRTFVGYRYQYEGFSDHLPLILRFSFR